MDTKTPEIIEVFADTGETIVRPATPEEIAQMEAEQAAYAAEQAAIEAQKAARQTARQNAIAKLDALGLTVDEIEALLGT
jgi:hypothetical protein